MPSPIPTVKKLKSLLADNNGNVLMIMALSMVPVLSVIGAGVDYGRAASAENQLNAYADAAALTGVTKTEMQSTANPVSAYTGTLQAYNDIVTQFNAQASHVKGASYSSANVVVTVADDNGTNTATYMTVNGSPSLTVTADGTASNKTSLTRNVTVTYTATVTNSFMSIVGNNTTNIGGTSSSSASVAPNIDFYVMMDTSPSMLFPTTSAGITSMNNLAGCAFACHQGNQAANASDMHQVNGVWMDSYQIARNNNVILRYDDEKTAVSSLMSTAYTVGGANQAAYRMNVANFDKSVTQLQSLITITDGTTTYAQTNANTAAANAAKAAVYVPWQNGYDSAGNSDNDQQTLFDTMMGNLNTSGNSSYIPTPGKGTNVQGDSPQKILFLVSDGFDENNRNVAAGAAGFGPIDTTTCDAIKSRGIRIAILYLQVYPAGWAPGDNQISNSATALANCASPNLMYTVSTGQDITTALANLFKQAVASAKLTN